MQHYTCIGCNVSTSDYLGDASNLVELLGFDVPICAGCRDIASLRREEIVTAITEVLRS